MAIIKIRHDSSHLASTQITIKNRIDCLKKSRSVEYGNIGRKDKVTHYDKKFYQNQQNGSLHSAKEVVPYIMDLVNPSSIIDVGCGVGTWLSVCSELGINDILGIDGEYIDLEMLLIPKEYFLPCNVAELIRINRRFDLVISIEVAEHLPEEKADQFIDNITKLGYVILFSAAIPNQCGTNHINEQWPKYWIDKFAKRGYCVIDCIREKYWDNEKVEWWYRQNMLFFVEKSMIDNYPKIKARMNSQNNIPLSIIHPKMVEQLLQSMNSPLSLKGKIANKYPKFYDKYKQLRSILKF